MNEYLTMGHMREISQQELQTYTGPSCYIPHHGIWQKKDQGKKLRVVFNASKPTSSGHSLSDLLYVGPKLQNDLTIVVTRWRLRQYAFCADIKMMFRQILVQTSSHISSAHTVEPIAIGTCKTLCPSYSDLWDGERSLSISADSEAALYR
ncbi:unnamed protein product [Trichogramma brassicae]|uniref:Uncharacterized protein n=1 Tax=Trichogramma brassicae TaxID=86971 RepID=A0A6H5J1P2_9HYME|nr:unnamed protein product [Trichogramma brassicae]